MLCIAEKVYLYVLEAVGALAEQAVAQQAQVQQHEVVVQHSVAGAGVEAGLLRNLAQVSGFQRSPWLWLTTHHNSSSRNSNSRARMLRLEQQQQALPMHLLHHQQATAAAMVLQLLAAAAQLPHHHQQQRSTATGQLASNAVAGASAVAMLPLQLRLQETALFAAAAAVKAASMHQQCPAAFFLCVACIRCYRSSQGRLALLQAGMVLALATARRMQQQQQAQAIMAAAAAATVAEMPAAVSAVSTRGQKQQLVQAGAVAGAVLACVHLLFHSCLTFLVRLHQVTATVALAAAAAAALVVPAATTKGKAAAAAAAVAVRAGAAAAAAAVGYEPQQLHLGVTLLASTHLARCQMLLDQGLAAQQQQQQQAVAVPIQQRAAQQVGYL
jgi:hypothetical protein